MFNFFIEFYTLLLKSGVFTKLLAKFAYSNLAAKFSAINLLNSGVVIYLS